MILLAGLDAVDDAIDAIATVERASVSAASDAVVTSGLFSLERDATILEAKRTEIAGEWEARRLYALDGSRSATARLARDAGISRSAASRTLVRARRLRTMARTAAAFAAGDLAADKVDLLCRANHDGRQTAFADAEALLLATARRVGVADLTNVIQAWIDAADDAGAGGRARRDLDGRYLSCGRRLDGTIDLQGRLDPVQGAIVTGELDRIERQLFLDDWTAAQDTWGTEVTASRLARTARQRRLDALAIMAERSSGADGTLPAQPLLTVHLDEHTFRHLTTGRTTDPDRHDHPDTGPTSEPGPETGPPAPLRRCELEDGTVLTPQHLLPWLSDAEVERVVFGPGSRIIDLGRRSRLYRGGARRIIEIRDRHCTFDGCHIPAHRCDIDHITEWTAGGTTDQTNGRLLCGPHNRQRPGRQPTADTTSPADDLDLDLRDQDDDHPPADPGP